LIACIIVGYIGWGVTFVLLSVVRTTRGVNQMNLGRLYQWGQDLSKNWLGVSRHFRANVSHFSRAIVYAGSSWIRQPVMLKVAPRVKDGDCNGF
jgi:hypothetical protein